MKDEWRAFGDSIKQRVDSVSDAVFYLERGRELSSLMAKEFNLAPIRTIAVRSRKRPSTFSASVRFLSPWFARTS